MTYLKNKTFEERLAYVQYVNRDPAKAQEDLLNSFCRCRPCDDDRKRDCVFLVVDNTRSRGVSYLPRPMCPCYYCRNNETQQCSFRKSG